VEEEPDDDVVEPLDDDVIDDSDDVDDSTEGDPEGNDYTGVYVPSTEEETEVDDGGGDDSTPGFSGVLLVVSLLGMMFVAVRRRR